VFDYDAPSKSRPRNIVDREQTKKLIADLKGHAKNETLLVAVDAEGGLINRLKPSMGFAEIDSAQSLAKKRRPGRNQRLLDVGATIGRFGIQHQFRAGGGFESESRKSDHRRTGKILFVRPGNCCRLCPHLLLPRTAPSAFLTALKHFPGHGSSSSDSHLALPDITQTYEKQELAPYEELIKNGGADSIMTAHVINRNIDPEYPATLSEKFINGILRQDLKFDGVVFSDDMQMGAIINHYGFEDAIIRAINAGCDILIFSNNGGEYDDFVAKRARDAILNAVKEGLISESRINESYARIIKLKEKLR